MAVHAAPPSSTPLDQRIAEERLRLGVRQSLNSQLAAPLGWAIALALAWNKAPMPPLFGWVFGFGVVQLALLGGLLYLRERPQADALTLRGMQVMSFVDGLIWGSLVFLTLGHELLLTASITALLLGVAAINAPARMLVFSAYALQLLGIWIPVAWYGLSHIHQPPMPELLAGMTVFLGLLLLLVRPMGEMVAQNIALKLDNQALAQQLRLSLTEVEHQAATDALTGLANRRALDYALSRYGPGGSGADESFALLLLDLDHFKRVNDAHGHAAGDAALKALALRVRAQLRPSDLLARTGGEEFVAVLQGVTLATAMQVAQRVCTAVADAPLLDTPLLRSTVSIGVAERAPGRHPSEVMAAADRALYEAKRLGRNRSCAAESLLATRD